MRARETSGALRGGRQCGGMGAPVPKGGRESAERRQEEHAAPPWLPLDGHEKGAAEGIVPSAAPMGRPLRYGRMMVEPMGTLFGSLKLLARMMSRAESFEP